MKDENILVLGMVLVSLGILIGKFLHFEYLGFSASDFAEGFLVGLSLPLYLIYMIRSRSRK